jgi:hypothetical protein
MINYTIANRKKENRTKMIYSITTQKTKDRPTGAPLNTRVEFGCSGRVNSSCSTCGTPRVTPFANNVAFNHL